jgi:hypothetical protein
MKPCIYYAALFGWALILVTLSSIVLAAEEWPPSCGPKTEKYDLKIEKTAGTKISASSDQSTVYFVTKLSRLNRAIYMVAIDGAWVGALRGDSYFHTTVTSGVHHACLWVNHMRPVLLELNLTPGKTYYVRGHWVPGFARASIDAEIVSSDEGAFLVSTSKQSAITRRK